MSACDGSGRYLGCPGCSECRTPATGGGGSYASLLPPPALRTPEWLADVKAREARRRLIPADLTWAQTHVPEPEF